MHVTANPYYRNRVLLYFAAMGTVWALLVFPVFMEMRIHEAGAVFALLWLACYAFLSFTTAYAFTTYTAYFFVKPPGPLPELDYTPADKTVALVCTVRNEETGLYERLKFSLNGNVGGPVDFWLLSDSDEGQEEREKSILDQLRGNFPEARMFYRRRKEHIHFKPGNLAEWLFCCGGRHYDYFFILDADALVMPGTIGKLLRKAEHPDNWDIWHFQCKTAIFHDYTHFAYLQKIALEIHERLIFPTVYAICGQWISYGHSNFVNTRGFMIAMPPTDELSHDVWDAAALDRVGYRSVIVTDAVVYEEAPANFLVAHKRDKRWTQGSLSALRLLGDSRVSLIQRFFVFQGGGQFLNNFVFSFWLLLQFGNMVFWGNTGLDFPVDFSIGSFAMNKTLFFVTLWAMGTFLCYPFLVVRNWGEFKSFLWGVVYSNLTMLNNLITGCLNVLGVVFSPVRSWAPMEKNPFLQSPVVNLLKKTLPTSFISMGLWYLAWRSYHTWWIIMTAPMLLGGVLSPLLCWWSGKVRTIRVEPGEVSAHEEPEAGISAPEKVLAV